uniref:Uncharacterized protein n=1 Tax=Tetranychus urticae TaxID=32264 RepID=T1KA27_TETUR
MEFFQVIKEKAEVVWIQNAFRFLQSIDEHIPDDVTIVNEDGGDIREEDAMGKDSDTVGGGGGGVGVEIDVEENVKFDVEGETLDKDACEDGVDNTAELSDEDDNDEDEEFNEDEDADCNELVTGKDKVEVNRLRFSFAVIVDVMDDKVGDIVVIAVVACAVVLVDLKDK